jgi:Ser/Thr protein kinase RdoA (MazF antagonist)
MAQLGCILVLVSTLGLAIFGWVSILAMVFERYSATADWLIKPGMMKAFQLLSFRGQLQRLGLLAQRALAEYPLAVAQLTPLKHEHNTTFRVTTVNGQQYMLRIHRPGQHTPEAIQSELLWLAALRRDTDLAVPDPIPNRDGELLTQMAADGIPEARTCVLLRWLPGRFQDQYLKPVHLERVGRFTARLHEYTTGWQPPGLFVRGRVDVLTADARGKPFYLATDGRKENNLVPDEADAARSIAMVSDLLSAQAGRTVARGIEAVRSMVKPLGNNPQVFGLIHADLHQENYFFHQGRVCAIDFDDCGWGFYLFDVTVTLWEIEKLPGYPALREAYLAGYRSVRPLPLEHENYLGTFTALRQMQILMWVLESRQHPAFRQNWAAWAAHDLQKLEKYLANS